MGFSYILLDNKLNALSNIMTGFGIWNFLHNDDDTTMHDEL
jgi:hypothetical protein